ncbi:MAG: TIGR03936 family radical SAM-associated protein [Lachnospiraceae bacterium]|nr:TIGR03936 family radical SAM-associated protein [Lachnospiraceae bacterium]
MKYVGHLDTMRYFQKAVKRAGLDIAYTEGFSPHPVMSFALPLGVGVTSEGEYMDIKVNSSLSSAESVAALNRVMTEGFGVSDYVRLPDDSKTGMTLVFAADYTISVNEEGSFIPPKDIWEGIETKFWQDSETIEAVKKGKHGETLMDIKPLIYFIKSEYNSDNPVRSKLYMRLAAGSRNNLKPDLVIEEGLKFFGLAFDRCDFNIHRTELLNESLVPLKDLGEII